MHFYQDDVDLTEVKKTKTRAKWVKRKSSSHVNVC